jgi:hypothetical protein
MLAIVVPLFAAALAGLAPPLAPDATAQESLTDIAGRRIGTAAPGATGPSIGQGGARLRLLGAGEATVGSGVKRYPAGYYLVEDGSFDADTAADALAGLFRDGTLEYLPNDTWDLGDIETGDVNGDGLDDIVFSISRSDCDSIPGTGPRIWIQNAVHRFYDESATRLPLLSTSTFDLNLFDADGDSDLDILLCGYGCLSARSTATLLINDGTGHFTDETASRLIGVPENHILYFAQPALIDSGPSMDIAAILLDLNQPQNPVTYPYLFLNTGDGHFWPDHQGRLLQYDNYGFFNVEAADLTGDGLEDLLFLNIGSPGDGVDGRLALFRNTGNGFMTDETTARMGGDSSRRTRDVAIADVDGDGDPDVLDVGFLTGGASPQLRLMINQGAGYFAKGGAGTLDAFSGWFNDAEFAPFIQDTLPDLYIAKVQVGQTALDLLLLNRGDGTFRDSSGLLPPVLDFSVAASVSDYDRDGDMDIVVGNSSPTLDRFGQNRLYINQRFSPATGVDEGGPLPRSTFLRQNYPNPFNASTVIRYALGSGAEVTVEAVNVTGQVVLRSRRGYQGPGTYEFHWDAGSLPGGVYFYSILAGGTRLPPRAAVLVK